MPAPKTGKREEETARQLKRKQDAEVARESGRIALARVAEAAAASGLRHDDVVLLQGEGGGDESTGD